LLLKLLDTSKGMAQGLVGVLEFSVCFSHLILSKKIQSVWGNLVLSYTTRQSTIQKSKLAKPNIYFHSAPSQWQLVPQDCWEYASFPVVREQAVAPMPRTPAWCN
jgi:hypothetical protein